MAFINHLKDLLKHSAVYSMATFLQRFIGLLMLPFLTNPEFVATKSEFANFTLYYTFVSFMNILFLYGMDASFLRFSILGNKDKKTVFSSTFNLIIISGIVFSFFIFFFRGALGEAIFLEQDRGQFIIWAMVLLFTDSLCNISYLLLRVTERSFFFSGIKIFRFMLELILNIFFVIYLHTGWIGMVYGNIIAASLNLLILVWINRSYFSLKIDFSLTREMLIFGLPFIPNSLAYMVIELIDRLIVPNILSKDSLAVYAANYRFGMIMGAFILAFRNAWQPFFLKTSKEPKAKQIFGRIFSIYMLITGSWLLLAAYLVPSLIQIKIFAGMSFLNENYWGGLFVIPILLLSYFFYGIYVFFTLGIYIEKKSKWIGVFTFLGASTNIAINLLFLKTFGIATAAGATLAAYAVMALFIYIYNQKIYTVELQFGKILKMLMIIALYFVILYLFTPGIIMKIIILITVPLTLYLFRVFDAEEWHYARGFIKRLRGNGN